MGLLSQQSIRRLSDHHDDDDIPPSSPDDDTPTAEGEDETYRLSSLTGCDGGGGVDSPSSDPIVVDTKKMDGGNDQRARGDSCASESRSTESLRLYHMGLMSEKSMRNCLKKEEEKEEEKEQIISGAMRQQHRPEGEIRMARRGVMSRKTWLELESMKDVGKEMNSKDFDDDGSIELGEVNDSFARQKQIEQAAFVMQNERQKQIEQAQMGLLSGKSMAALDIDHEDLQAAVQQSQSQKSLDKKTEVQEHHMTEGELRLAKLGCLSKKSMQNFRDKGVLKKSNSVVTFSDADGNRDSTRSFVNRDDDIDTDTEKIEKVDKVTPITTAKKPRKSSDDEVDNNDTLIFSKNELLKKDSDILTEGQYFLGISMLVYMYSHLRETCRMGHTRCKMEDIDVHSLQSQYRVGKTTHYLDDTKTAGSIIRIVIDELDYTDENEEENDIVGDENKEYEKR